MVSVLKEGKKEVVIQALFISFMVRDSMPIAGSPSRTTSWGRERGWGRGRGGRWMSGAETQDVREKPMGGGVDWVLLNHSPLYFHSLGSIAESDTLPWCGPSL